MNGTDAWWLIAIGLGVAGICLAAWRRSRRRSTPVAPARLHFTNHVKQRMIERNVERQQIEYVITAPARAVCDAENNSVRLERDVDGATLRVWVAQPWPTDQEVVIKTTAWADRTLSFSIPTALAGLVIGRGGSTIRRIEVENDVRISISRTGSVRVSSHRIASAESAKHQILAIVGSAPRAALVRAA